MTNGNIRMPDLSVTLSARISAEVVPQNVIDGAPDICVEVVSPSENEADMLRKIGEYFDSGARLVWLVIPETERIAVYTSPLVMRTLAGDDELTAGDTLPDFRCAARELFELD